MAAVALLLAQNMAWRVVALKHVERADLHGVRLQQMMPTSSGLEVVWAGVLLSWKYCGIVESTPSSLLHC
jgi:hypothetical protein